MSYGPTNKNAFKAIPELVPRKLSSHPDDLATSIPLNTSWYREIGSGNLSDAERLGQRWNEWVLL